MCGIAGIKSHNHLSIQTLERMVEALYHRGPDSSGWFQSNGYLGGMRRLAINDVTGGDQPLYNSDRSVVLLYNGEIYNSPEIRLGLQKKGFQFRTGSDGEVICHLYEIFGADVFEHLDGMFACALWSEPEKKLILARDLSGEKPLYYSILPCGGIVFASEARSLLKHPEVSRELDYQAIWDFPTFLWIPEPATAFRDIKALPRGHILVADEGGISVRPYANRFGPAQDIGNLSDSDLAELVRETVTRAVHSRLLSDVPVGSFLSGGLDSSIIATLASKKFPSLSTFTIGFEDLDDPYHGKADESSLAEATARKLGTDHHLIRVTGKEFRELLPDFCSKADLPFAVSSGLGVMAVARAARDAGIKVLLTGDGADEAFGGYSWYPLLNQVKNVAPDKAAPYPVSYQNFGMPLDKRLNVLAGYSGPEQAWAWHYYAAESEKAKLFASEPFSHSLPSHRYFSAYKMADWQPVDYIRQDQQFYFPFEMLRKADRMTMAFSVEGRIPFAAPAVQALAAQLKYSHMVRGTTLKWILRKAFENVLPREVVVRPKHGFNVPIDHWLKNDWSDLFDRTFSRSSNLAKHGLLAKEVCKHAIQMRDDDKRLNGHTLFSYIMLDMWLAEIEQWK